MGIIGLLITVFCYFIAAVDFYRKDKVGMAIAFIAYAIANIGFMFELIKKE
jgi:hypothetical protein|tara:strand:- start:197 stop:349 length:153 start_codon:yes stop_codon:yes gene_type:complete